MSQHDPPFETLVDYACGQLDSRRSQEVEALIAASAAAQARVARVRLVLETLRTDDSITTPASVVARAKAIFRAPAARTSGWFNQLRPLLATLLFDSFQSGALAGARGEDDARQLTWEWPGATLDVQVESLAQSPNRRLMGQISAPAAETIEIALVPPGADAASAETASDEHGMFSLQAPPGRYDLYIRLGETVVKVPAVEIH
jgi:hypothetical protein